MAMRLRIKHDSDPINVRKEYDHAGTMVCWHRRYELGDEQPRESPQEWRDAFDVEHPDAVILPLYLYDHSGITISTGSFSCAWDSGQVGWIYVTRETIDKEWPAQYVEGSPSEDKRKVDEKRIEQAEACLRAEVEEYDAYLTGDCWGYVLLEVSTCDHGHEHEEHIDSCWGFIGSDNAKSGIPEHLPENARALFEQAWEDRSYS